MATLSFALQITTKLLCSCLRLFDAIINLHVVDEKLFNHFLIRKRIWIFGCNMGLFNP